MNQTNAELVRMTLQMANRVDSTTAMPNEYNGVDNDELGRVIHSLIRKGYLEAKVGKVAKQLPNGGCISQTTEYITGLTDEGRAALARSSDDEFLENLVEEN